MIPTSAPACDNPRVDEYGTEFWYQKGYLHREDGPAVVALNGARQWYHEGLLHRTDGPAVITSNNSRWWYIRNNRIYDRQTYQKLTGLTDEDMTALILKYGEFK